MAAKWSPIFSSVLKFGDPHTEEQRQAYEDALRVLEEELGDRDSFMPEAPVCDLRVAEESAVFSSGMAAISTSLLALVPIGQADVKRRGRDVTVVSIGAVLGRVSEAAAELEAHGIEEIEINFESEALSKLIRGYTREAGVRQLERNIGKIVRKLAVKIAGGESGPFVVNESDIEEIMGPEKFTFGVAEENDEVGVVTGLAVNAFGGDTLPLEYDFEQFDTALQGGGNGACHACFQ